MMRHSRSLHEVLRCGLLALALTLSLSLAAAERPLRVPSASGLRPLAEWSTLQDTVTARALFTPQEPAVAPVEWQPVQDGGGYVVASGTPEEVAQVEGSYTGQYLKRYL